MAPCSVLVCEHAVSSSLGRTLFCRGATNDYFDNRLVGRLFFRLIGLNKIILFY